MEGKRWIIGIAIKTTFIRISVERKNLCCAFIKKKHLQTYISIFFILTTTKNSVSLSFSLFIIITRLFAKKCVQKVGDQKQQVRFFCLCGNSVI